MAKKYYVVWQGRNPGIFNDWAACQKQVEKFPGAKFKSFKTLAEAEAAFGSAGKGQGKPVSPTPELFSGDKLKKPTKPGNKNNTPKTYNSNEVAAMRVDTKIFTDGGCDPNPGEAGSGIAVYRDEQIAELWYGLYNPRGTNNTAELNALHQALIIGKEEIGKDRSVAIFCDSKYSIQCVTQWAANWKKKGWKKPGGEIKNLDLIKELFSLYESLKGKVSIHHVNGHVGVEGNELADRMSILAIDSKDPDFTRYRDEIDIDEILALRAG